jgi:hypothetical protein
MLIFSRKLTIINIFHTPLTVYSFKLYKSFSVIVIFQYVYLNYKVRFKLCIYIYIYIYINFNNSFFGVSH